MIGAVVAKYLVRKAFDALNDRDIDGFLRLWSNDAVFHFPGDVGHSSTADREYQSRVMYPFFMPMSFRISRIFAVTLSIRSRFAESGSTIFLRARGWLPRPR